MSLICPATPSTNAFGVTGSPDSLCVCGTNLMYAYHGEIYLLRDGYPRQVSKKIGKINPICAADYKGKYYVLCKKEEKNGWKKFF